MDTATRAALPRAAASRSPLPRRLRRLLVVGGGPALIVAGVLFALRGFAFLPLMTNQHPDVLSFWLPRSCLLGRALSSGHVPLWNPFEMAGTPFAADPQSGWLYAPVMAFSWLLGCGDGLRVFIVFNPILAGLGMWWFLRKEGLGRPASTAGGLSLAMAMAASSVAISLPFAGTLAWTPIVLVGASGFFSSQGWRRVGWLGLGAFAWGQVASAHLSHGLVMCTGLVVAYLVARAAREVRAGRIDARSAALLAAAFVAVLPLANLAILLPRFALIDRSSLRAGYGALEGTVAGLVDTDRPVPTHGIWSAWPFALASTPGAYLGAAILLAVPLAWRDRGRRFLVLAFGAVGIAGYLLTISLLVGWGWFRSLVLLFPFGDVYLHNPGRLRYLALLVVPVLGAIGIQALLERRPSRSDALRWLGLGLGVLLVLPLALGANPQRLIVFALASGALVVVGRSLLRGRRWAGIALVGVLAAELTAGALWSSVYHGGTVYFGLEGSDHPALVPGPVRWPEVPLERYLSPTPISERIGAQGPADGRYLAWIQPAAYFVKGYLFTQGEPDWPALLLGRAILFELRDALGYSPIQLPRYWSYIRATNRLPVYYNATAIQLPSPNDARLFGVRFLVLHESQPMPAGLSGRVVERDDGYVLVELDDAQPRASVVPAWREVDDGALALTEVLGREFDPAAEAVVEGDPRLDPVSGAAPGTATYAERAPEDVRVDVAASAPSIVVIRNTWDRGWKATVDGRPAPVLRTDFFLQGVPVPAGEHEIRLVYREPAIGVGLAGSALVWAALVVAAAAMLEVRRRAGRRRASRSSPAPPRGA